MPVLPILPTEREGIVAWVGDHLGHLTCDEVRPSSIRGGQAAAGAALDIATLHPWPWLRRLGSGSLRSYSAWAP